GLVAVDALVHEELVAGAAVVDGGRVSAGAELARDALVGILDARVGDRELAQEGLGLAFVVLRVDAEEGDAAAEAHGLDLEGGELDAARAAPRAPQVDHHRVAAQAAQPALELLAPSRDQAVGLAVQA